VRNVHSLVDSANGVSMALRQSARKVRGRVDAHEEEEGSSHVSLGTRHTAPSGACSAVPVVTLGLLSGMQDLGGRGG
jgi:hypothetical protein